MKKMVSTAVAVMLLITGIACTSVNPKRKTCEDECAMNKKACHERARDKKGDIDSKKKTKCNVDAKACSNDCARKFR
jgi:hypothetical protein